MNKAILTVEEQALVANPGWIYLKNNILQKVMSLLGDLHVALQAALPLQEMSFPGDGAGKLSKGERYKDLPYIMLDYPRYFSREDIFAFRTMFWWGHYFIATLHLGGELKQRYSQTIIDGRQALAAAQFQIYVREDDPWHHDFENGNFRSISALPASEFEMLIHRLPFIKIAKPWPLENWEGLIPGVVNDYTLLLQLLRGL